MIQSSYPLLYYRLITTKKMDTIDLDARFPVTVIGRTDYPDTLAHMKGPPRKLYLRGKFPAPEDHKYLCVIGSRTWSVYGRDTVFSLVSGLKGYPISIVSGLAIGIDSFSHMAALQAGLHCVAFPGSTLEWRQIYPRAHLNLAQAILTGGGAVMSPWMIGYHTDKWAFPARNRLMAGLADAVLIVEAARGSGSLMTARYAEDFGREVLAVPGWIGSEQSYGPHMLLRSGAGLVSCAADLLEFLGFKRPQASEIHAAKLSDLDPVSRSIMTMVSRERVTADLLVSRLDLSAGEVSIKLSLLELKGLIKIEGGIVLPDMNKGHTVE